MDNGQSTASAVGVGAESPYRGLAPYTEDDSDWFFGRDSQVRIISTNLMSARITVLYAGSGVGKTSLLRAGVVPALRKEAQRGVGPKGGVDFAVALHTMWQDDPIDSLLGSVANAVAGARVAQQHSPPGLQGRHFDEALVEYAGGLDADILLIFDQFEEWFLYHAGDTGEGSAGDELVRAMGRTDLPVHYLVSLREDALARLDWFKGRVPGLFDNLLRLRPLDRPAARQAIEAPLARYNTVHGEAVDIEADVVDRVLDDVRAGAVLVGRERQGAVDGNGGSAVGETIEAPFLQLVMTRLWQEERARESRHLRLETLEDLGAADRIVRTYLDETLDALDDDDQALAADAFNHLVTPSGTKIAHSAADLAQYTGSSTERLEPLLNELSRMRILRPVAPSPGQDRSTRFEIFHDVLAASILDWRTRYLNERSREQLARGLGLRFRRTAAVMIGIFAIVVVAFVVYQQKQTADRNARESRSGRLAGQALAILNHNPAAALRPALDAVHLAVTPTSEDALRATVPPYLRLVAVLGKQPPIKWVAFATSSSVLAFDTPLDPRMPSTAVLWDIRTNRRLKTIPNLVTAAISDQSGRLVTVDRANRAHLWNLRARTQATDLGHDVDGVAISADGTRTLTWTASSFSIWTDSGRRILQAPLAGALTAAAFSPNHRWFVTVSTSGAELWRLDATQASQMGPIPAPPDATSVAVSRGARNVIFRTPTGAFLSTVGSTAPRLLPAPSEAINSAEFDPSGHRIVTTSEDGIARIYDSAGALTTTLATNAGSQKDAVFGLKGAVVATAGTDGRARIWNTSLGVPAPLILGGPSGLVSVAFNQDNTMLVTGGADTARVWRVAPPSRITIPGVVLDASVSPINSALVAIASPVDRAYLWTRGNAGPPRPLGTLPSSGVAFSDDGRYVATTTRAPGQPPSAVVWRTSALSRPPRDLTFAAVPLIYQHPSFSKDDRSLVLATTSGAIVWWWRSPGLVSRPFPNSEQFPAVYAASYSPIGTMIVTGETSGVLNLWKARDIQPDALKAPAPKPIPGRKMILGSRVVGTVAFDPRGTHVAAGDADGDVGVWDVRSHRPVSRLNIPAIVTDVSFSNDGRRVLVSGTDGTVRVWDWEDGKVLATLQLHAGATRAAEYLPGKSGRIMSAGDDGIVEISKCLTCIPLPAVEQRAREHERMLRER